MATPQENLQALYDAIIAKSTGKQVQSAGHKDKTVAYAQSSLGDLLKLYRMHWVASSGLPDLKDLDQSTARRGPPARVYG